MTPTGDRREFHFDLTTGGESQDNVGVFETIDVFQIHPDVHERISDTEGKESLFGCSFIFNLGSYTGVQVWLYLCACFGLCCTEYIVYWFM